MITAADESRSRLVRSTIAMTLRAQPAFGKSARCARSFPECRQSPPLSRFAPYAVTAQRRYAPLAAVTAQVASLFATGFFSKHRTASLRSAGGVACRKSPPLSRFACCVVTAQRRYAPLAAVTTQLASLFRFACSVATAQRRYAPLAAVATQQASLSRDRYARPPSLRQIREMVATLPAHGTAFASSGALITIKKLALLRAARFLMVARPPGRAPCGRPPARPALMPIPRLRAFASVLASRPGRAVVATLPHYLSAPAPKAAPACAWGPLQGLRTDRARRAAHRKSANPQRFFPFH